MAMMSIASHYCPSLTLTSRMSPPALAAEIHPEQILRLFLPALSLLRWQHYNLLRWYCVL